MQRKLPSLNAIRYFEVVASQGSVKKAAQILNVSESAISRQVRILEEQLNTVLFDRTNSGLEITRDGQRIARAIKESFDHIESVIAPLQQNANVVTLRVIPTFALRWLFPRLGKFHKQHPTIRIVVQTRLDDMTVDEPQADLGIRYGLGDFPHDYAMELYQEWIAPVCTPEYYDRCNIVNGYDDAMLLHPLPDRQDWLTWSEKTGVDIHEVKGLDFDALDMALSAAEAGIGVAIADVVLVNHALQEGRITFATDQAAPTGVSYFLVRRPELKKRRQVTIFENWLLGEIREAHAIIRSFSDTGK